MLDVDKIKEVIDEHGWVIGTSMRPDGCCLIGAIYLADHPIPYDEAITIADETDEVEDHLLDNYSDDPILNALIKDVRTDRSNILTVTLVNDSCMSKQELFDKLDKAASNVQ